MHGQGVSTTPSAIVLASQTAIVPTAIVTAIADLPALEVSAPEPLPEPEHTPNATSIYAQSPSAMHYQGMTTMPSAIVSTNQTVIAPTGIVMPIDDPALEPPAPKQLAQLERIPDAESTYTLPFSAPATLDNVASLCNDLLKVVHGASDGFPLLKSALIEVFEIWNRCEVRILLLGKALSLPDFIFRQVPKLKMGSKGSRARSRRS